MAAFGAPLFYLSGCGGGGSSSPNTNFPVATPLPSSAPGSTATATPTASVTPTSSGQTVLFSDEFAGNFDTSKWGLYTPPQQLQRALFGAEPIDMTENGTTFTRLTLDSYNPDAPGQLFRGTEFYSYQSFAVGQGLEAEARLRAPGLPSGLVFAFFLINDRYEGSPSPQTYRKDEIDYEFLTAQNQQIAGARRNYLYTNIWNDWNERLYGYDPSDDNTGPERTHDDKVYQPSVDPNFDYANWNTYKIRWLPDRTELYVNNRLERTETDVKPDNAMSLHFNFWTPNNFPAAFSGDLPGPVDTPTNPDRKIYQFDVDYVRVTSLSTGANAARIAPPAQAAKPVPGNLKSYRNG